MQWSDEGISASFKFIQKLWNLNLQILEKIKQNHSANFGNDLEKITNLFIDSVTKNLSNFSYNKIVANFHELYSSLVKEIQNQYSKTSLIDNYIKILITMSPVIPHFAYECLSMLQENTKHEWPIIKKELLVENTVNFVVQINGKKRGVINSKRNIAEEQLFQIIIDEPTLKKYIENKEIKKKIFIPNRLINIII